MPFTENELKQYLTEHLMNAPEKFNHEYDTEDILILTILLKIQKLIQLKTRFQIFRRHFIYRY